MVLLDDNLINITAFVESSFLHLRLALQAISINVYRQQN